MIFKKNFIKIVKDVTRWIFFFVKGCVFLLGAVHKLRSWSFCSRGGTSLPQSTIVNMWLYKKHMWEFFFGRGPKSSKNTVLGSLGQKFWLWKIRCFAHKNFSKGNPFVWPVTLNQGSWTSPPKKIPMYL